MILVKKYVVPLSLNEYLTIVKIKETGKDTLENSND